MVTNCKRCQQPKEKIKTQNLRNSVNENGKSWLGSICPSCTAAYMRERRTGISDYPEKTCGGCGTVFKPKTIKSNECSAKCHMRVKRALLKTKIPSDITGL